MMYAASEYKVGEGGIPVNFAHVIVARYMSATEGIVWLESSETLLICAGDAEDKARKQYCRQETQECRFHPHKGGCL